METGPRGLRVDGHSFCVPFGFIADDGTPRHAITLGLNPADNPKLLHRLSMGREIRKDADFMPKLLEQAGARQVPIMVFVGNRHCIQIHSGPVNIG